MVCDKLKGHTCLKYSNCPQERLGLCCKYCSLITNCMNICDLKGYHSIESFIKY